MEPAKPRPNLQVFFDLNFEDGTGRRVNISENKVYDRKGAVVGSEPCFESYTIKLNR